MTFQINEKNMIIHSLSCSWNYNCRRFFDSQILSLLLRHWRNFTISWNSKSSQELSTRKFAVANMSSSTSSWKSGLGVEANLWCKCKTLVKWEAKEWMNSVSQDVSLQLRLQFNLISIQLNWQFVLQAVVNELKSNKQEWMHFILGRRERKRKLFGHKCSSSDSHSGVSLSSVMVILISCWEAVRNK